MNPGVDIKNCQKDNLFKRKNDVQLNFKEKNKKCIIHHILKIDMITDTRNKIPNQQFVVSNQ